jgi:hypothetical protein
MRWTVCALVAPVMLAAAAVSARAACSDPAAVAATRAAAEATCPCASATNHGQYVKCVAGVAKAAVAAQTLPANCKGAVVKCAARSTCGKAGFVTCCRTKGTVTKCSTKSGAAACKAPKGGTACVGVHPSCCDACTTTGCASPSAAFLDTGAAW